MKVYKINHRTKKVESVSLNEDTRDIIDADGFWRRRGENLPLEYFFFESVRAKQVAESLSQ